jgi:hypothetical protein
MDDIEEIETRRLHELEKKAALAGPQTEPAVLIEIQELKHKYRVTTTVLRREFISGLDYDFLMNTVASALVRLGVVEANQSKDRANRYWRQFIHDIWMIVITIMVFLVLLMYLIK